MNFLDKKVTFFCRSDIANLSNEFAKSLRAVGVAGAKAIQLTKTPTYVWPDHYMTPVVSPEDMRKIIEESDIICYMHSQTPGVGVPLADKKVMVFHGGTDYRKGSGHFNRMFNKVVDLTLIQTCGLFGKGAKAQTWMLPAIDTGYLKPRFNKTTDKIVIGHHPSGHGKGTGRIAEAIRIIKMFDHLNKRLEWRLDGGEVTWEKNIERMAECDIYIESLAQDKIIGQRDDWSVQALEAAALGCVVVTNFECCERYKVEYGECGLQIANGQHELFAIIKNLLEISNDELYDLKLETRKWVEERHGLVATGKRFLEVIFPKLYKGEIDAQK